MKFPPHNGLQHGKALLAGRDSWEEEESGDRPFKLPV